MGALKDLWSSERGLVALGLIAACTVMSGIGHLTVDQWLEYTKWIFITYVAGKSLTGAVQIAKGAPTAAAAAPDDPLAGAREASAVITKIGASGMAGMSGGSFAGPFGEVKDAEIMEQRMTSLESRFDNMERNRSQ